MRRDLMYRITGHYPMVVSDGRAAEQEAISYRSWNGWLMTGYVPAVRGDDVALKGDVPCRFRQIQRMGERVPSAGLAHPYRVIVASDHWGAVS